jgi:hypothetical protein
VATLPVSPRGSASVAHGRRSSGEVTVDVLHHDHGASTMMPKSMAPMESRLADRHPAPAPHGEQQREGMVAE